jgi:hypothetical protein
MNTTVKYIATITNVREVSLLGTADLNFWKGHLKQIEVYLTERDGKAQLLISAVDSQYKGIRFRELSIGVYVCRHKNGAAQDGFYLVHAVNSSRLFALIERKCFSTPYYYGNIHVNDQLPASIHFLKNKDVLLRAEMSAETGASNREPSHSEENKWEGPIFLPVNDREKKDHGKVFFAKVGGHTHFYPFSSSKDVVAITPSPGSPILAWLIESGFSGKEWIIRGNATHARSKTFRRNSERGSWPNATQ